MFPDDPDRRPIVKKLPGKCGSGGATAAAMFLLKNILCAFELNVTCSVCLSVFMKLQKVRGLLHRLLKVPAADLRLTYSSPKVSLQDLVVFVAVFQFLI